MSDPEYKSGHGRPPGGAENEEAGLGAAARRVAESLVYGLLPKRQHQAASEWWRGLTPGAEAGVIAGVLLMLFGFAVVAAQFGWIGLLAYGVAVVLVVN